MVFTTFAPAAMAATVNYGVIKGATNDLDYVYNVRYQSSYTYVDNVTDEASDNDNDVITLFPSQGKNFQQFLVMGMATKFNTVYLNIEEPVVYNATTLSDMKLQYLSDSGWKNLKTRKDEVGHAISTDDQKKLAWNLPEDWKAESFQGHSEYWVRFGTDMQISRSGKVEQVSAVARNLKLKVKDTNGNVVIDLKKDNFIVKNGTDNNIYGFRNYGGGVYELSLQAEAQDTTYDISINTDKFKTKKFSVDNINNVMKSYTVELEKGKGGSVILAGDDCSMPFKDVNDHWAQVEIHELFCRNIVNGRTSTTYVPNANVTRAEFLKIALLNAGVNVKQVAKEANVSFNDVSKNDWYYDYAAAAYELNVITSRYTFRPNDSINRAEAVAMVVRLSDALTYQKYSQFNDVNANAWYAPYIDAAYRYGVVEGYGDGSFRPANNLTRAEAAVVATNAYEAWYVTP